MNTDYFEWLEDDSRSPVRALLLELQYDGGKLRFGSQPYLSNRNLPYDDGIVSQPYIEESLSNGRLVGDVEVIIEDKDINVNNLNFRGQPAVMLSGDLEWNIEDFFQVSTSTIENCRLTGINRYQFDLIASTEVYRKTFFTGAEAVERTETIQQAIDYLLSEVNDVGSISFVNVPQSTLNKTIKYEISDSSTLESIITSICNSINAYYRTSPDGFLQIIKPNTNAAPLLEITSHSIAANSFDMVEIIPAYSRITVNYDRGELTETLETQAITGSFDDEYVVDSLLVDSADVVELLNELADQYGKQQVVYSLDVVNLVDLLQVGDYISVNGISINSSGIVSRIRREPLSTSTTIEIRI